MIRKIYPGPIPDFTNALQGFPFTNEMLIALVLTLSKSTNQLTEPQGVPQSASGIYVTGLTKIQL